AAGDALDLPVGVRVVVQAQGVGRLGVLFEPVDVQLAHAVAGEPRVERVVGVDATEQQVHHEEAAQVAAVNLGLEVFRAGLVVFGGVAEQDGGVGGGGADGAGGAADGLHDAAEDRHVATPLARVGRPEAEVAAEQGADQRLVEGAEGFYG